METFSLWTEEVAFNVILNELLSFFADMLCLA
jgi:hypothetical protein